MLWQNIWQNIDIEVIDGRSEDVGLHDLPGSPARFRGRKSDQLLGHSDKCLGQRYEIILQNIRNFILSVCGESLEEILKSVFKMSHLKVFSG